MSKLKTLALGALALTPLSAYAQEAANQITINPIVSDEAVASFGTSMIESLTPWILAGLGIGAAVLVVYLGWRFIRRFIGR